MKAIRVHDYGDGSVLRCESAPEPSLQPNDVLVRVHAAGVNPADWQFRRGDYKHVAPLCFPAILGWDVAGTVDRLGPTATGFRVGDPVFAMCDMGRDGAYAEFVAVRDSNLAPAPATLSLTHCAGVPLAALTAWHALFDLGQLQEGQKVLVHAAAGGVGQFAVQLARSRGARVTASAHPSNHAWLQALGTEMCVDYTAPAWQLELRDIDIVLDGAGGATRDASWSTLRRGGMLVAIAMPPVDPALAEAHGCRTALAMVQPDGGRLREIAKLIDSGGLRVEIDSEYPLDQVAVAHARSESRHARGKIILVLPIES